MDQEVELRNRLRVCGTDSLEYACLLSDLGNLLLGKVCLQKYYLTYLHITFDVDLCIRRNLVTVVEQVAYFRKCWLRRAVKELRSAENVVHDSIIFIRSLNSV